MPPFDTDNNDENESIYRQMSLVDVPDFPQVDFYGNRYQDLVDRCRENGHEEALFRHGMDHYFGRGSTSSALGREWLMRAANGGHPCASIAYCSILVMSGGDEVPTGLNIMSNAVNPSNLQECRDRMAEYVGGMPYVSMEMVFSTILPYCEQKLHCSACGADLENDWTVGMMEATMIGQKQIEWNGECKACDMHWEVFIFGMLFCSRWMDQVCVAVI
ncbi:hypothetical protein ACFX15_029519 [Malus domestica]